MSENTTVIDMAPVETSKISHSDEEMTALVPERAETHETIATESGTEISSTQLATKEKISLMTLTAPTEGTASRIEVTTTNKTGALESTTNIIVEQSASKTTDIPAYERLSTMEKRLVLIGAALGMFLSSLDQIIVVICLPTIVRDLKEQQYLAWVLSAYLLTSAATMPLYGKYSDIYGRHPMYLLCITLFLGGSMACGFATGMWYLIGFRALQGLGGGGLVTFCYILIGDVARPEHRAKLIGSVSAVYGLAVVLAPVLGGVFVVYVNWRWVFFINMPFGVVAIVLSWFGLNKIQNAQKQLPVDVVGSILVFTATVCLVLVVTWGGANYAWNSWQILLLIFVSFALLVLYVIQELRHPEPIVNIRLFRIRNLAAVGAIGLFFGICMFGGYPFIPIYFEDIRKDSAIWSGLKLMPMVAGMIIGSFSAGGYVSKKGKFVWVIRSGLVLVCVGNGLLSLMNETMTFAVEWIFQVILGAGLGICIVVINGIIQNSVPPKDMASTVSGFAFIRFVGGALGIAIYGSIYDQQLKKNLKHYLYLGAETRALQSVFLWAMAAGLVAFVFSFILEKTDVMSKHEVTPAPTTTEN